MTTKLRDDLTSSEARENGVSGSIVPDERGYLRAIFAPEVLTSINALTANLIETTNKEYGPIDARRQANLAAYEAAASTSKDQTITVPVIKRDVNQQLAWLINTIFSKDPTISCIPLESGNVQVIIRDAETGAQRLETVTTEEEANALESLVEFYLSDRIGFRKIVTNFCHELLTDGNRPPVLKVVHDPQEVEVGYRNVVLRTGDDSLIEKIERDPLYKKVTRGEATRIELVPGDKFFIPFPYYDIQSAPFVYQEFEESTETIKDKLARGVYDLCKSEEPTQDELDAILSGEPPEKSAKDHADGRVTLDPRKTHKLIEFWWDFPFAEQDTAPAVDELGQPVLDVDGQPVMEPSGAVTVRMRPFCSVFHPASKKLLNTYENNYWHRRRPFFAGRMQDRPFSFSGYSTTENIAPFQRLISTLFHLQVQNMVASNAKVFFVRAGTTTFNFLTKKSGKIRPGLVIPYDDPTDINPQPFGSPIGSMANEISFLNGESSKMSVITEFDRGAIPSRTPVGTVDATQAQAKMQPAMVLDNIRETLGETVKMFVQTLIQFSPEGIVIPFRDPKTKALVEKSIGLPREVLLDKFAFRVAATADDETPQALITRDLMLTGEVSKCHKEMLETLGQVTPMATPAHVSLLLRFVRGRRNITARVLEHARHNPDDFIPSEQDIETFQQELLAMQQQRQMQQQQGAMNEQLSPAGPLGPVPGGGGFGQATGLMEGQPNDPMAAAGGF
jgi:hypothetical protein